MVQLSQHLRVVVQGDGAVLLDVQHGNIIRCNHTGGVILKLLSSSSDERAIIVEFARVCGLSISAAEVDVDAFLSCLVSHSLLIRSEGASGQG